MSGMAMVGAAGGNQNQHAGGQSLVAAASAALGPSASASPLVPSSSTKSANPLMPSPSTASTASAPAPLNPLDAAKSGEHAAAAAQQEHKHGMLGSVFKQGFFGRPVLRTDEESYRYIMALDR